MAIVDCVGLTQHVLYRSQPHTIFKMCLLSPLCVSDTVVSTLHIHHAIQSWCIDKFLPPKKKNHPKFHLCNWMQTICTNMDSVILVKTNGRIEAFGRNCITQNLYDCCDAGLMSSRSLKLFPSSPGSLSHSRYPPKAQRPPDMVSHARQSFRRWIYHSFALIPLQVNSWFNG